MINLRLWASWGVMNGATSRTRADLPMPIKDTDTESVGTCSVSTSPQLPLVVPKFIETLGATNCLV